MWYVACMIRGMSIDEAIRQLRFVAKKGAGIILETLLEAQEKAIKEHNVEFKSNLWVGEYDTTSCVFFLAFFFIYVSVLSTNLCAFQLNHFRARASR